MAWQRYDSTYSPGQKEAFKLSRSKIDLFLSCPRCFWLDRRKGIKQPQGAPFTINSAIDELLKKEFDTYRDAQTPHPYMVEAGVDAVPFAHEKLDDWRHTFTGIQSLHQPTNLLIFGAVDDIWINTKKELLVVDYKATAKDKVIDALDPPGGWQDSYRRQIEVYQWLLRQNGFTVAKEGYFVYANAKVQAKRFDARLDFDVRTFPHVGDDSWVEATIMKIHDTLEGDIPEVGKGPMGRGCEHCAYARSRTELTLEALRNKKS